MRCSDCSNQVKPVVCLDLDGTLGDYHLGFVEFAERYLGRSLPRNHDGGEFNESLGIEKEEYRRIKLAYRQGGIKRTLQPFHGARDLVDAIVDAGGEIWYTTTRPYLRVDTVDPDTRFWLQRHGLDRFAGLLFDDEKYKRVTEIVDAGRIVGILDDLPEQVAAARDLGLPSVLNRTWWNRNVTVDAPEVTSLHDAADIFVARIEDWYEANT